MTIKRPEVSKEIILEAAKITAEQVLGDAEEIADCYHSNIDGYELAKKLENSCSWDIDVSMIDALDEMQWRVDSIHKEICMKWVVDEDIKPPLENGTKIKEGVIDSVSEYDPAKYLVIEYGEKVKDRYRIVNFENAVAI